MALTDYVIMPGEDYQAICDAVREKRNETEVIKSGEIAGKIQGIETAEVDWLAKFIGETRAAMLNSTIIDDRYHNDVKYAPITKSMFEGCSNLTAVPLFDTSEVINMSGMFSDCSNLAEVPLFDTSKVTDMSNMFYGCNNLTAVPLFDTSEVRHMSSMFSNCKNLIEVPLFDTNKVVNMASMFSSCNKLTMVPSFDTSKVTSISSMFNNCTNLTECWLRNIKINLQVGNGTSWGHLLTLDSLIHLIYECRDTGSLKTLTVGSANLEKLANVYVRTIEITDEMRAEDDLIDEKLPFEVCESTDEGAMLIIDYAAEKNWSIK